MTDLMKVHHDFTIDVEGLTNEQFARTATPHAYQPPWCSRPAWRGCSRACGSTGRNHTDPPKPYNHLREAGG